jgi:hypothetical protein
MTHIGMAYQSPVRGTASQPINGQICAIFAVDIVDFGRRDRDDDIRLYLREGLYRVLQKAFDDSGVPWAECYFEDRGDGALIVVPPEIPVKGLINPLPDELRRLVRRHNHVSCEAARLQLRAAVHIGPVEHDEHGLVGTGINLLFRMLEALPLKRALAESGADLALIVSDYVHSSLVRRHPDLDPGAFRTVRFQAKNTGAQAWIHLPSEASQDTRSDIDQAMTTFRAALAHLDSSAREAARIRNLANVTDAQVAAETGTLAAFTERTRSQTGETATATPLAANVTRLAEQGITDPSGAERFLSEPEDALGRAGHSVGEVTQIKLAEFGTARPGAAILTKGVRVTGVDRSKLATTLGKRYDSGESIRSLAASTGRSYGFVHRILTETGVTLRGRSGAKRSRKVKR